MVRLASLFLLLTLFDSPHALAKSFVFYVATNGNDGWSGQLERPARSGRDGPLATLPAALKASRAVRRGSPHSTDRATSTLRGGIDRKTGLLTYCAEPSEDLTRAELIAPGLSAELVQLQGDFSAEKPVQHVVVRGITFAYTDWTLTENGYLDTQASVREFRLRRGSAAWKMGFKPIDLSEVGVRRKFRKQVHDTD